MDELVIALNGPNGIGKSPIAKLVAQKLRLAYLDTGVMYRAVACKFARWGLDRTDETRIGELARAADLRMTTDPNAPRVCTNGRDITEGIRKSEISVVVPTATVVPGVRRVLTERMHWIIVEHDRHMAAEEHDVTTVVVPDTGARMLFTADAAARIGGQAVELGEQTDQIIVMDSILKRDRDNSTVSNFTETADGMSVIDSTRLGLDGVVAEILKLVSDV